MFFFPPQDKCFWNGSKVWVNYIAPAAYFFSALQECPTSGLILAETIDMEPAASKKARSKEALKRNDKDPRVVAAVAK